MLTLPVRLWLCLYVPIFQKGSPYNLKTVGEPLLIIFCRRAAINGFKRRAAQFAKSLRNTLNCLQFCLNSFFRTMFNEHPSDTYSYCDKKYLRSVMDVKKNSHTRYFLFSLLSSFYKIMWLIPIFFTLPGIVSNLRRLTMYYAAV